MPSPPQAGTRVSTSSPSTAHPGLGYRPKVKVFADEIPGWPRYSDFPSSDLDGSAAPSPPTPSANQASADGQATPTISAVDLQSAPLNASSTAMGPNVLPDSAIRPSVSFATTSGTTHSAIAANAAESANAAGSHATWLSTPGYSAATQADLSATPLPPSARGSQLRYRLIKEAMGEK